MRNNTLCAAYRSSIIKVYKIAVKRAWENYRHEIYDVKNIISIKVQSASTSFNDIFSNFRRKYFDFEVSAFKRAEK